MSGKRPIQIRLSGNIREQVTLKTRDGFSGSFAIGEYENLPNGIHRVLGNNEDMLGNKYSKQKRVYTFDTVQIRKLYGRDLKVIWF